MSRVLIVEDNPQNLKLARLVLAKAGFEVLEATDGEQGVRMAREQRPDLVLMDVQMPGLDGLQAIELLRADPATAALKIVVLSALAMKGDRERILCSGCDAYVAKPFDYKELVATVSRVLAG
ncbi:response regulator [Azohydromonas caseinilytica]|uniref:Response regulator n=1 Tax=Azohydromonas caseinilytica TaxID=2728836 RepID=A0A848FC35_9BURK|nr:response regulator [Azohydromonas caseinilytica]NML16496.1 response regulator [Azohydromonas caseinilytica]